ncbi:MAG: ABC transporter ATP-binding protein, partial [Phycisphaerales bacterium]
MTMAEKMREPSSPPLIDVAGLSKSFAGHIVLNGISFRLPAGRGLCICGPNAAGKSTLLRIAAGLVPPGDGGVRICGYDLRKQPEKGKAALGAIFHSSMVYPQLTVLENLRFFAALYAVRQAETRINELLERSGLMPYRYDAAGILSRGMTQRLAISRALVHAPAVLLADEPFTGLDVDAASHFTDVLNEFRRAGGSFVMTTHNVR